MIDGRYYVKIVPERGERVHRFAIHRSQLYALGAAVSLVLLGVFGFAALEVAHARAQVADLRVKSQSQQSALDAIDRQTSQLRVQLRTVQKQDQEIRTLIGAPTPKPAKKTGWIRGRSLPAISHNVARLSAEGIAMQNESTRMRTLAMRVLNIRHVRDLVRAQMVAAIPSIDPVAGAPVIGCYCYRTSPDVEFHPGVDLGADYGDPVRAAAAGTVVANAYDGGYGIKIDIDHGNGYHTWYAHLSRADVAVGDHVFKGETIAQVGSTGFSTGPHLHYQVMLNGSPVDPTPFLTGVPATVLAKLP